MTKTLPATGMAATTVPSATVAGGSPKAVSASQAASGWRKSFTRVMAAMPPKAPSTLRPAKLNPREKSAAGPAAPPRKAAKVPSGPGRPISVAESSTPTAMEIRKGLATAPTKACRMTDRAPPEPRAASRSATESGSSTTRSMTMAAATGPAAASPNAASITGRARKPRFPTEQAWPKIAMSPKRPPKRKRASSAPRRKMASPATSQAIRKSWSSRTEIGCRASAPTTRAGIAK